MYDDDSQDIIIQSQQKKIEELKQMLKMKQFQIQTLSAKVDSLESHAMNEFDEESSVTSLQHLEFSTMLTRVQRMQNQIEEKKRKLRQQSGPKEKKSSSTSFFSNN